MATRSDSPIPPALDHGPSPLWAVLTFTFLNSIGGGVVTTGFSFLAESAYGFTPRQNYLLGLLQGLTYIVFALGAGPGIRRLIARFPIVTERGVVAVLMLILAAFCTVPWVFREGVANASGGQRAGGGWAIWVLIGGYSAFTGMLWPIVESFVSGGRAERDLRRAIGIFNITWSGALPIAFWLMAEYLRPHPLEIILTVSAIHIASAVLLPFFRRGPGLHPHEAHAVPESYKRLLVVFRFQLPVSYLVYSALGPYLPAALQHLRLADDLKTPLASVWLVARVATFAVLQAWHGWHGRWATAWVGCVLILTGFGVSVLAPRMADDIGRGAAIGGLIAGLSVFGVGMGIVYFAALYYVMEVGRSSVDAGGSHEALIGMGYLGGPVCGVAAIASADLVSSSGGFEVPMLIYVSILALLAAAYSFWRAWHGAAGDRANRSSQ